jgi:hypothetical protein
MVQRARVEGSGHQWRAAGSEQRASGAQRKSSRREQRAGEEGAAQTPGGVVVTVGSGAKCELFLRCTFQRPQIKKIPDT